MDAIRWHVEEVLTAIERTPAVRHLPAEPWHDRFVHPEFDPNEALTACQHDERRVVEAADRALLTTSEQLAADFYQRREVSADAGQRLRAQALLRELVVDRLVDTTFGLDYALELRRLERLVRPDRHAAVFFALVSVAGWDDGLERENHGFGYHFHHIATRRGVVRTNVLMTFSPSEPVGPPDTLYWEHHGPYSSANPLTWAPRRCQAMHSSARPSIRHLGKASFRAPSNGAAVLWAR